MKAPVLSLVLVASAAPFLTAAEVEPGDSLEAVQAVLGSPKGQVKLGGRHLVYFERGAIELRDAQVVRVALRTPEEQAAQVARDEAERAMQAERRVRLEAEGSALRDRKLADELFRNAPVAYQVSFWENFARSYPGVACAEPLAIARLKLTEQEEEKSRKEESLTRLAEIEARLAAADRERETRTVRYVSSYHGRYQSRTEFALGPVTYRYFDAPLPVYTSPTTPLLGTFTGDLAQPERRVYRSNERDRNGYVRRDGANRGRRSDRL